MTEEEHKTLIENWSELKSQIFEMINDLPDDAKQSVDSLAIRVAISSYTVPIADIARQLTRIADALDDAEICVLVDRSDNDETTKEKEVP